MELRLSENVYECEERGSCRGNLPALSSEPRGPGRGVGDRVTLEITAAKSNRHLASVLKTV